MSTEDFTVEGGGGEMDMQEGLPATTQAALDRTKNNKHSPTLIKTSPWLLCPVHLLS